MTAQGIAAELVHHSDRGVHICRFGTRNDWQRPGSSHRVGSRGDSYDNALVESVIGLFKTEVIRRQGPWRNLEEVVQFNRREATRSYRQELWIGV